MDLVPVVIISKQQGVPIPSNEFEFNMSKDEFETFKTTDIEIRGAPLKDAFLISISAEDQLALNLLLNAEERLSSTATIGVFAQVGEVVEGPFEVSITCRVLARAKIGPNEGKKIKKDDKIIIKRSSNNKKNFTTEVSSKSINTIRVLKGPQFDYFSKESHKVFFSKKYKISNFTDRMGMRLEGTVIKNIVSTNIRSEGITKGAIQVPADGQPIILLTDYPTIGGYPKIANVISADYDLLIQKTPGEEILFKCVTLHEAEKIYKEYQTNISKIIKDIKEIH